MNEAGSKTSTPLLSNNRFDGSMPTQNDFPDAQLRRRRGSQSSSDSNMSHEVLPSLSLRTHHEDVREYSQYDNRSASFSSPAPKVDSVDAIFDERVHCLESEKLSLMIDHNNLIREFNKRMESHLDEIRNLKEINQQLTQESTELRDLSCYLDDDRQKCRKLAKEWQRFGRYTLTVMRNEVMSYQEKLGTLEGRQVELIKENGELRDLCIYLDGQRIDSVNNNDAATLRYTICKDCTALRKDPVNGQVNDDGYGDSNFSLGRSKQSNEYVKSLESQVKQLEKEKETLHKLLMFGGRKSRDKKKRVSFSVPDDDDSSSTTSDLSHLDYPPSFGSTESFSKAAGMYDTLAQQARNLRNGPLSPTGRDDGLANLARLSSMEQLRHSQVMTDDQIRHNRQTLKINELREKMYRASNTEAEGTSRARPKTLPLHSTASPNDSREDIQSPLSPPPPVDGVFPSPSTEATSTDIDTPDGPKAGSTPIEIERPQIPKSKPPPPPVSPKPILGASAVASPPQPPGYEETIASVSERRNTFESKT